jgi:photosystem II stability/assembly factor-like uncharacterized protein
MNRHQFLRVWVVVPVLAFALYGQHSCAQTTENKVDAQGDEVGENSNTALLRAQAFHDMYAGTHERRVYRQNLMDFEITLQKLGTKPVNRPLPIDYSNININERLRVLTENLAKPSANGFQLQGFGSPTVPFIAGPVWRNLGPANGAGRVSAVAFDPNNPAIVYRGTADGGVWRSVDSGRTWAPLIDELGDLSIGSIAVAPSDSNILYVGTGEGVTAIDGIEGIGFISSTNGGQQWNTSNSVLAGKFFDLNVHPRRPLEVLAATSRGLFKSTNGGTTWSPRIQGLYATQIVRMPSNPSVLLAAMWDETTMQPSNTGTIYRSEDGGDKWDRVGGSGLKPFDQDTGRVSLAISASSPNVAYALAASAYGDIVNCPTSPVGQHGFYRSIDGGKTWDFRSNPYSGSCPKDPDDPNRYDSVIGGQGWYANTLIVSPTNPDVLYAGGIELWRSIDGAMTWTKVSVWSPQTAPNFMHADIHTMIFDGGDLYIGNDGGLSVARNEEPPFAQLNSNIPTRQYYSIAISPGNRDLVMGGSQDNGTSIRVGSTKNYAEVIGGDGIAVAIDPNDPSIVYGTAQLGEIYQSKDGGRNFTFKPVPFVDKIDRLPFLTPLTMDPTNSKTLYTGTSRLWRTTNGGDSWEPTSNDDLAQTDKWVGYITKIAISKIDPLQVLVASSVGVISKSPDGGRTWIPLVGLPEAYATHVEFDPINPLVFYVAFSSTTGSDRLYRTEDGGSRFSAAQEGLPNFPVHVLRVDPNDTRRLFAGTDLGLYTSHDRGQTWSRFPGLPFVCVWDLVLTPDGSALRVATHGRGFYEIPLNK